MTGGAHPVKWMVFAGENRNLKWRMTFLVPPRIENLHIFFGGCKTVKPMKNPMGSDLSNPIEQTQIELSRLDG